MQQDLNQYEGLNCIDQFNNLLTQLQQQIQKPDYQSNQFESDDYTVNLKDQYEDVQQINLIGETKELIQLIEQLQSLTFKLRGAFSQVYKQSSRVTSQQESQISKHDNQSNPSRLSYYSHIFPIEKYLSTIVEDFQYFVVNQIKQVNPDLMEEWRIIEGEDNIFNYISNSFNIFLEQLIQDVYSKVESRDNSQTSDSFQQKNRGENQQSNDSIGLKKNQTQYSMISEPIKIQQVEQCQVMCFNKKDSLIFTGIGNNIQIWNYQQGSLEKYGKPLIGHQSNVTAIVFSRRFEQNFISGAEVGQNSIIMWSFVHDKWYQTYPNKQEKVGFKSMIFNLMNDKLFTSDSEGYIKIWNVDFSKKIFDLGYEFQKQQGQVISITLNQAQTQLISCGESNKLIIWQKRSETNWIIIQEIEFKSQAIRVKFLNDTQFIVATKTDGYLYEFRRQRKKENFKETAKIQLNQEQEDLQGFPLKHNKELYFAKHNRYFYILKSSHSKIQIVTKLEFSNLQIYGTLSQSKKILIIWHDGFLNLYNLNYF